jgi:hypothetical protein
MKKLLALIGVLLSSIVLFTPFDLPPFPFFFIDEALALIIFTKCLGILGLDITRFLPFLRKHSAKKSSAPESSPDTSPPPFRTAPAKKDFKGTTIDV